MPKQSPIDTLPKFEEWLNRQFDSVQVGEADNSAVLREASLFALRLGAGDIAGQTVDDASRTATLAAIGKLLAWCKGASAIAENLRGELNELRTLIRSLIAQTPTEPRGELLTAGQVAKQLCVSQGTVYELAKCGKLTCSRIGKGRGTLRFDPADLKRFKRAANSSRPFGQ